MLFTEELRKCLNAAGLSDCGENDAWNYWYQRVLKAHNEAVERQIATEQAENAKLRELVRDANKAAHMLCEAWEGSCSKEAEGMSLHTVCPISDTNELCVFGKLHDRMRELGIEVDE